jgi:hypothetical protein
MVFAVMDYAQYHLLPPDRGQTFDEAADIDLDRGVFVDGNCLVGKALEKRTLVAILVEDGSIERDCLPFLLESEGWARQGSDPVKNNAIGECPEGRSTRIKGFLPMQKVEDEILLIVLDLHPWYGPASREAAGIETDIAQDAAVDAAVAIAGLHGESPMVRMTGSGPDHSPLAKLRRGRRKTGGRTARAVRGAKRFNGLWTRDFFGERQTRAVKIHRWPLRAWPPTGVQSQMAKRAT